MKRIITAGVAVAVLTAGVALLMRSGSINPAAAQSRQATREIPRFDPDPSWPRLPAKRVFGQVSSVSIDERGHAWIL